MRRSRPIWFACLALLVLSLAGFAQARGKRLILKDGSYQLTNKWEIKGDRVRYYSTERYQWEELPKDLVDWAATERFQKEAGAAEEEAASGAAQDDQDEASPLIAPGIRLPDYGGVFLLDNFQGNLYLPELVQNGSELNRQMGKNILRAVLNPLPTGSKQTIELKGLHARIQAHQPQPSIYVNMNFSDDDSNDPQADDPHISASTDPQLLQQHFRIVRLEPKPKKKVRIVGNLSVNIIGKMKEEKDEVPAVVEPVSGDWVKVTPTKPLEPGEYALVEMLGKQMNMYVWDFGVNPNAPVNPSAWKPAPVKSIETGTTASPILNRREPH